MTVRPGMSGDAIKRIEEFLANLKLYLGPIDSSFGGGLSSAVKSYQKQQGLAPSGVVIQPPGPACSPTIRRPRPNRLSASRRTLSGAHGFV